MMLSQPDGHGGCKKVCCLWRCKDDYGAGWALPMPSCSEGVPKTKKTYDEGCDCYDGTCVTCPAGSTYGGAPGACSDGCAPGEYRWWKEIGDGVWCTACGYSDPMGGGSTPATYAEGHDCAPGEVAYVMGSCGCSCSHSWGSSPPAAPDCTEHQLPVYDSSVVCSNTDPWSCTCPDDTSYDCYWIGK